jgi:hypothetical protein
MTETHEPFSTLQDSAARQLAITTKTAPQLGSVTPRWLVRFLPWTPVEAGTYRINRAKDAGLDIACSPTEETGPAHLICGKSC